MQTRKFIAILVATASLSGCSSSPEEEATEIAEGYCTWAARCGEFKLFTSDPDWTAKFLPTTYDECFPRYRKAALFMLECEGPPELPDGYQERVDFCREELSSWSCYTQEGADAIANGFQKGVYDPIGGGPVSCQLAIQSLSGECSPLF